MFFGGVALLLWATRMVRTGFQRAYGADLRQIIRLGTRNRFLAFLAGLGVTGRAVARFLVTRGARVVASDLLNELQPSGGWRAGA